MALAVLEFLCWEAALFSAAVALARRLGRSAVERCLLALAIEVALESSIAGLFSFTGMNSRGAYWIAAAVCAAYGWRSFGRVRPVRSSYGFLAIAALVTPLVLLAFHPVDEIDSINYLHYLIDWMANRSTPYNFATYYVAFWELSFLPTWVVTGFDWFFPLLAMKSLAIFALGAWLL